VKNCLLSEIGIVLTPSLCMRWPAHHAEMLGWHNRELTYKFQEYLSFLCKPEAGDPSAVLDKAMQLGATNLETMRTLEEAHTTRSGAPRSPSLCPVPAASQQLMSSASPPSVVDLATQLQPRWTPPPRRASASSFLATT